MTQLLDVLLVLAALLAFLGCAGCVAMCIKIYSEFVKEAKYREPR